MNIAIVVHIIKRKISRTGYLPLRNGVRQQSWRESAMTIQRDTSCYLADTESTVQSLSDTAVEVHSNAASPPAAFVCHRPQQLMRDEDRPVSAALFWQGWNMGQDDLR